MQIYDKYKEISSDGITKEEFKDAIFNLSPETYIHCQQVSNMFMLYGVSQGLQEDECNKLAEMGFYHDVGKYDLTEYVNSSVVTCPNNEDDIMHYLKQHTNIDNIKVKGLSEDELIMSICHHLRFEKDNDGKVQVVTGYGSLRDESFVNYIGELYQTEQIEEFAHKIDIGKGIDVFSALIQERSYKSAKVAAAGYDAVSKCVDPNTLEDLMPTFSIMASLSQHEQSNPINFEEASRMYNAYNSLIQENPEILGDKQISIILNLTESEKNNTNREKISQQLDAYNRELNGPKEVLYRAVEEINKATKQLEKLHNNEELTRDDYNQLLANISININDDVKENCEFRFDINKRTMANPLTKRSEADSILTLTCIERNSETGKISNVYRYQLSDSDIEKTFNAFLTREEVDKANEEECTVGIISGKELGRMINGEDVSNILKLRVSDIEKEHPTDLYHIVLSKNEDIFDESTFKVIKDGIAVGKFEIPNNKQPVTSVMDIEQIAIDAAMYCKSEIDKTNNLIMSKETKEEKINQSIEILQQEISERFDAGVYIYTGDKDKEDVSYRIAKNLVEKQEKPFYNFNDIDIIATYKDILDGKGADAYVDISDRADVKIVNMSLLDISDEKVKRHEYENEDYKEKENDIKLKREDFVFE